MKPPVRWLQRPHSARLSSSPRGLRPANGQWEQAPQGFTGRKGGPPLPGAWERSREPASSRKTQGVGAEGTVTCARDGGPGVMPPHMLRESAASRGPSSGPGAASGPALSSLGASPLYPVVDSPQPSEQTGRKRGGVVRCEHQPAGVLWAPLPKLRVGDIAGITGELVQLPERLASHSLVGGLLSECGRNA